MELPTIRDADLLAELESIRGSPGFQFHRIRLEHEQQRRDRLAGLSRDARRRALVRTELEANPNDADDLRHIHSVLAMCGLPYNRQPLEVREFERRQGRMSLVVEAGKLRNPETGNRVAQPLPFGPKSRLLLMHLCSEAIRQKAATIEIADSLTGFLRDMGFPVTGGKKGTLNAFKEQINALAACKLSVGMWDGHHSVEYQGMPFSRIDIWLPSSPDQLMLWPSTLTFSTDFYTTLAKHALPIRAEAVRAFAGSARKLDMYFWFNYRLHRLKTPAVLSWQALADQFGGGFARQRAFRAQAAKPSEVLAHACGPSALQSGFEPNRTGLRQAQRIAAKGQGTHRRSCLEAGRQPARMLRAARMRRLPQELRKCCDLRRNNSRHRHPKARIVQKARHRNFKLTHDVKLFRFAGS